MPTVAIARRTQEERTASTRAKLLDATIECLVDLGYARTTTTEIAKRAGVSRGAQLHHFPTKTELVITAVEYVINRRTEEFRAAFAELPAGTNRAAAAVDMLWSVVSGPTFFAWLELMVAARTDGELRPTVAAMAQRFAETVQRTFTDLFPPPAAAGPLFNIAPQFAFALLGGLAIEVDVLRDTSRHQAVIDFLKLLASVAIPTTTFTT